MSVTAAGRFSLTVDRGVYEAVCNFLGEEDLLTPVAREVRRYVRWCLEEEAVADVPAGEIDVFVEACSGSGVRLFCDVPVLELLPPRVTQVTAFRTVSYVIVLTVRWLRSLGIWSEDLWPLIHRLIG